MRFNNRKLRVSPELAQVLMGVGIEEIWQELSNASDKSQIKKLIEKNADKYRGLRRAINGEKIYLITQVLRLLYYNKCAYCETRLLEPDVEHYRPKRGVTKTKVKGHPGYYWLCYEWTNLLPACHFCNSRSGKWNKFPIMGERVTMPPLFSGKLDKSKCVANHSPLIDEQPYLLHPEIDDPKPCFKFYENGKIEGVDSIGRGAETIRICDLDRGTLRSGRKGVLDDFRERIMHDLKLYMKKDLDDTGLRNALEDDFKKLDTLCEPHQEYSLTAIYAREHFDEMIVSPIEGDSYQKIVSQAHKKYLDGSL